MNKIEWLGLAAAGAVLYASFTIPSACGCGSRGLCPTCRRGSRDVPPVNACSRVAKLHRALGDEESAKAYDDLAEAADSYVLDECVVAASDLRREHPSLAKRSKRQGARSA